MAADEDDRTGSFKVQDRRRFDETGEPRRDAPPAEDADRASGQSAGQPAGARTDGAPVHIDFTTYVILLAQAALAHLGEIPNPIDKETRIDLPAAQQVIDILAMLKEKTKSNLDPAETGLLDRVMYDLRLKYVERVKAR